MSTYLSLTLQLTLNHPLLTQASLTVRYPLQFKNGFISFVFNSFTSHIWCHLHLKPDPPDEKLLFIMGFCLLWRKLYLEIRPKVMRILFLAKKKKVLLVLVSDSDPKQIKSCMKPSFYLLAWYKETVGRIGNALKGDPFISMILWQVINSEQCCSQCTVPAVPIIQLIVFFKALSLPIMFSLEWLFPSWKNSLLTSN